MTMTEELFRDDATLRECRATVLALSEGGVILDRTVFYPLGGGQAGDAGALLLADGRRVAITEARKSKESKEHPGAVLHLLAPDTDLSWLAPGTGVTAQID
jgi:misacylated tRNA(Ala) deacylase